MGQQVVTITPNGTISGLQRKSGKGLDLRQFGKASIRRVSEITWCEARQRWLVEVMSLNVAQRLRVGKPDQNRFTLTYDLWRNKAGITSWPKGAKVRTGSGLITFEDYDDAVAAEVTFLDALRVKGIF